MENQQQLNNLLQKEIAEAEKQLDPYKVFKDALAEGKIVQAKVKGSNKWSDITNIQEIGNIEIENYRIKHKWQDEMDAFERGEAVQIRNVGDDWYNLPKYVSMDVFDYDYLFKIKESP